MPRKDRIKQSLYPLAIGIGGTVGLLGLSYYDLSKQGYNPNFLSTVEHLRSVSS